MLLNLNRSIVTGSYYHRTIGLVGDLEVHLVQSHPKMLDSLFLTYHKQGPVQLLLENLQVSTTSLSSLFQCSVILGGRSFS